MKSMAEALRKVGVHTRLPATLVLVAVMALAFLPWAVAPASAQTIYKVYVSDVTNNSFVVSWTTDTATDGHVDYGTTTSLGNTASDSVSSTTTHRVQITGLSANTLYYFQVRSGTTTDDNGGSYYTATTGSAITPRSPICQVWGYVYESDGTTAVPNALVYLQLQDDDGSDSSGNSQWVTARTESSGVWSQELANVRVADASAYFYFSQGADNLRIVTQGGDEGCVGEDGAERIVTVPASCPGQFDTTLDANPNAITLQAFSAGSALQTDVTLVLIVGLVSGVGLGGAAVVLIRQRRKRRR